MKRRISIRFRKLRDDTCGMAWNKHDMRLIEIDPRMLPRDILGTAVHEALHLANWDLSETRVELMTKTITDVLWRMGYRRSND